MDMAGSSNLAVASSSTIVLPKRVSGIRVAFSISNYSALVVYLNLSDAQGAIIGQGIALYPGMTVSDSTNGIVPCWQGTITAIEATGAATLAIWERVKS
jgi:hypothetical protein